MLLARSRPVGNRLLQYVTRGVSPRELIVHATSNSAGFIEYYGPDIIKTVLSNDGLRFANREVGCQITRGNTYSRKLAVRG